MRGVLTIWTVYRSPSDFPDKWVLRAHDQPGGARLEAIVADTLATIRAHVPPHLHRMARNPADDPVIYETWF